MPPCTTISHSKFRILSPFHQSSVIDDDDAGDDDDDHLKQHGTARKRGQCLCWCSSGEEARAQQATMKISAQRHFFYSLIYYCNACVCVPLLFCMSCYTNEQMIWYECMFSMHLFCLSASAKFPSSIEQFESIDIGTSQNQNYALQQQCSIVPDFCCCRLNSAACVSFWIYFVCVCVSFVDAACRCRTIRYYQRKT